MATLPNSLKQVSFFLQRLPGIGEKTANRLAFYFLRLPQPEIDEFVKHLSTLKSRTKLCSECMNLTEDTTCNICSDKRRDHEMITVVEEVLDIISFETGNIYHGVYHVLHGRIDPLNHIGPEDIYVNKLLERINELTGSRVNRLKNTKIKEIILATNPDMEGEATALFIKNRLLELKNNLKLKFKISRLGYGLPIGANLEYADYMTLRKSIENRNTY